MGMNAARDYAPLPPSSRDSPASIIWLRSTVVALGRVIVAELCQQRVDKGNGQWRGRECVKGGRGG